MAVERLLNKSIKVKELHVAAEERNHFSIAEQQYQDLKRSPLYDADMKQWNWYIDENQKLVDSGSSERSTIDRFAYPQLAGILVESKFDKKDAQIQYDDLKHTRLYDSKIHQWQWYMRNDQQFGNSNRKASAQLLGIWVESIFDKDKAYEQYELLKETDLYDDTNKLWNDAITSNQKVSGYWSTNYVNYADDQLLGIIVEGLFNKDEAKEQYKMLKQTKFYDSEKEQWNWSILKRIHDNEKKLKDSSHHASSQLLGAFVEEMFDSEKGRVLHGRLKKTELFDEENNQWNEAINDDQELLTSDRYASTQLIGVFTEYIFGQEQQVFTASQEPLPAVRSF